MRLRILEAAKQEFAAHGLAGARVDRIAAKAGANKRMLYYHVGNKDDLYLAVLEGAYEKIRGEERGLDLEHLDPPEAIKRLIDFTWNYFLRNPEFLALLNTENLARAKHLKRSTKVKSMHSPFVEMIRTVVRRGVESGDFQVAVDPVQLYISIAALELLLSLEQRDAQRDLRPRSARQGGQGRAPRAHGRAGAGGADRKDPPRCSSSAKGAEAVCSYRSAAYIRSDLERCTIPDWLRQHSGLSSDLTVSGNRWTVFIQRVNFSHERRRSQGVRRG